MNSEKIRLSLNCSDVELSRYWMTSKAVDMKTIEIIPAHVTVESR